MLLMVGLGNPDPNNKNNRHNIGFRVIDSINKKYSLSKQKPKFKGLLTTGKINEQKVFAIKPLTFMNKSGVCVRELLEYFKISADNIFVFHDDLDISFGKIKTKFGGSSAGHNGIESIDKCIGKEYSRIRIGINHPKEKHSVEKHVLENFTDEEEAEITNLINKISSSVTMLLEKKLDLFSSKVNQI
ncbi:MAG: aminoacyl-tRNA hydrolase [Candidatus Pelagibacter sp. TMED64]|nr:aminoacyl-tRNA hydrolase [Candidatus Pelagibacter sp.]OUU65362.1 MAG: aminoacyl-tRNA hydrolase [Candidatus Pelagibacter sp. TMED64]